MSASTQTLQQPRRLRASAALILAAILVAIVTLMAFAARISERSPVAVPAPAVSVPARMGPGAGAADRHAGPASIGSVRPGVFRDGSVKIGSSADFVPPHGSGDFRGGAVKGTFAGGTSTQAGGLSEPIQIGGYVCHQCR
jgi:hypothetical protein